MGVHTPEFAFERKADNVRARSTQNGLRYPVAQDNAYATWNAWGNQFWPAKYLIDARGRVRYTHFGEGDYDETERADPLAAGRGGTAARSARSRRRDAPRPPTRARSPRRPTSAPNAPGRFLPAPPDDGIHRYPGARGRAAAQPLRLERALERDRRVRHRRERRAASTPASSPKVFLVMSSADAGRARVRCCWTAAGIAPHAGAT